MARNVAIIGLDPEELAWVRLLTALLRHADPVVPELTRHALTYLETAASKPGEPIPPAQRSPRAARP